MKKNKYYELNKDDLDKIYYFAPKGRGNSKKGENTMNIVSGDKALCDKLFKEAWELQEKIDKLIAFINNDNKFSKLDRNMQCLLNRQLEAMKEYNFYLSLRMRLIEQKVVIDMKDNMVYELKGELNALYGKLGKEQYDKLMGNVKAEGETET